MPCFEELFRQANSRHIKYNGKRLVIADQFSVANGETLLVAFEHTHSQYKQGICIDISGYCEIDGKVFQQGKGVEMLFWEDTAPKTFKITVFTESGFVWIQNYWKRPGFNGIEQIEQGHNGAAMIVEEIENGKRYRCNDGIPDDDFNDIVFTIRRA